MPTYYSDDFNRADGPLGVNWISTSRINRSLIISSDSVVSVDDDGNAAGAAWWQRLGSNQSNQIMISSITAQQLAQRTMIAIICRSRSSDMLGWSASNGLYVLEITTASGSVTQSNSGGPDSPGTAIFYAPAIIFSDLTASAVRLAYDDTVFITQGDTWKLECLGTTLTAYRNGAQFLQATDSNLSDAGFGGFAISADEDGQGTGSPSVDDWKGIDFSTIITGWEQGGNVQIIEREGMLTG